MKEPEITKLTPEQIAAQARHERHKKKRQAERAQRRLAKEAVKHRVLNFSIEDLSIDMLVIIDSIEFHFKRLASNTLSPADKMPSCKELGKLITLLGNWIMANDKIAPAKIIYALTKNLEHYKEKLTALNSQAKKMLDTKLRMLSVPPPQFAQQKYSPYTQPVAHLKQSSKSDPEDTTHRTYRRIVKGHQSN